MTVRRVASLVLLAACAALAGCAGKTHAKSAGAGGAQSATVTGPASVLPGKTVRFKASGFRAGSVELVLAPADKTDCCSIRIRPAFAVASDGTAVLQFAMPAFYKRCAGAQVLVCKKVAWQRGEKVVVTVSGYLEQAKTTTRIGSRNV
jgi:hypothetical protein